MFYGCFCFFLYVCTVFKRRRNAGFKKLIKSNSNYDIITIKCIVIILIFPQMLFIFLFTQLKPSSIEPGFFYILLAIDKYGFLCMKTTVAYVMLT